MKFSIKKFHRTINSALTLALVLGFVNFSHAKKDLNLSVQPSFWWVGMKHNNVQLIFHAPGIGSKEVTLSEPNTTITGVNRPQNPNYVIVDITIGEKQQPGTIYFQFSFKGKKNFIIPFDILARDGYQPQGLSQRDLMYLIFPDRFANGDPMNDVIAGMHETTCDRKALKGRHGGDLQGILNHLDYCKELGVTALWLNPILENNQDYESYHGYAATNLYKVDPRLGSNELFQSLVEKCHDQDLKIVCDVVYNHIGSKNELFTDLIDSSWVHWFPQFTRTNYRAETLLDPYASNYDKNLFMNGWFDKHMPDINQSNPATAKYLIQNSIWWIEYANIDAFRIDTYSYPDQVFMSELNQALRKEYPTLFLFGETWVTGAAVQAWFPEEGTNASFNSMLHGVTDFQWYFAVTKALNEPFGWEEGFRRIESNLSHDYLYKNPSNLVTFLDNHDLSRIYTVLGEDDNKWKMAQALLLTQRGIPCIYYGTEIKMKNAANPDALVREDFPGGWSSDSSNKFMASQRNEKEAEAFSFIQNLAQFRLENKWFTMSKTTQFVPENNTYVYFRYDQDHTVMCAYNLNSEPVNLNMNRFAERVQASQLYRNIITGEKGIIGTELTLPAQSVIIIDIKK